MPKHRVFRIVSLRLVLTLLLVNIPTPQSTTAQTADAAPIPDAGASKPTTIPVAPDYGQMPLLFVENRGQVNDQVAYYLFGGDKDIYFTPQGVTFALTAPLTPTKEPRLLTADRRLPDYPTDDYPTMQRWAVKLDFVDANPNVQPVGEDHAETIVSYFKGPQSEWRTGLATYHRIVYRDLWPGIDLVYYSAPNQLKYELIVQPGADPTQIRLTYRGATSVTRTADGQLEIATPLGSFKDGAPVAYQEVEGERTSVAMAYAMEDVESEDLEMAEQGNAPASTSQSPNLTSPNLKSMEYTFDVGDYDPTRPLILDPAVIVYSGFIGGSKIDIGRGIAVDDAGNAYVTGETHSTDFPATGGPDLTHNGYGYSDAFVAKVNAAGTGLVYAGFLGGNSGDYGRGIAVDGAGNAYVTGLTDSTDFPATGGPDLTHNGGMEAFVAKVNAAGTGLVYAGFLGGNSGDYGRGIAVDGAGNAYVTGLTDSTDFPATGGPDLTHNGSRDAFVAKVNAAGTGLVYAGFLGGSVHDEGNGIAVDGAGNAYVTGITISTDFPVTGGPDLTYNGGQYDAFVAQVNAAGTGLVYAGFLGGSDGDGSYGIAVDGAGNAYVTGWTYSDDFPATGGPDLTYNGGQYDAFVAQVNAAGTGLVYAGFLGGSDYDVGEGITVDGAGNAYVTGKTCSIDFPATGSPDLTFYVDCDVFVAKVNAAGTGLIYAGFLGGIGSDGGYGIAVDGAGNAYVTGITISTDFPVTGGPDLTHNGGTHDAFVTKIGWEGPEPPPCDVAQQPLLLVHGWGGPDTMANDEMGFAQLSQWLQQDGYVEGCNMWYATGVRAENSREMNRLAIQRNLRNAYGWLSQHAPDWNGHFDIIAHSYGGLNSRDYLESELYSEDQTYRNYGIHIDNLFTLGSPHGGVIVSDKNQFELYPGAAYIGWEHTTRPENIYDFLSAAGLLAETRAVYNITHAQPAYVCYRLIGGDFLQQTGVPGIVRLAYAPYPTSGDIGVSLRSSLLQPTFGDVLFGLRYPRLLRAATVDMHGYFPPKTIPVIGELDMSHLRSYVTPTNTYQSLIRPFLGTTVCSATGVYAPTRAPSAPQAETPSAAPVLLRSGQLAAGATLSGATPVDWSGSTAFYVSWLGGDLDFTLRDPAGTLFTPTVAISDTNSDYGKLFFGGAGMATYGFTTTLTGAWTYTLTNVTTDTLSVFDLYVNPDSVLVAEAFAPEWQAFGVPAVITASLVYAATPVTGATMQAQLARPDGRTATLTLVDNGLAPDVAGGDGIYSGRYTDTTASGYYHVVVTATGVYSGAAYYRSAQTVFPVASDKARLSGSYADAPQDANGDGLYEALHVSVGLSVTQPLTVAVSASLFGAGNRFIGLVNTTLYSATGLTTATLTFPGAIVRAGGVDGPYTVTEVMLVDSLHTIKLDSAAAPWVTAAYTRARFITPPITVTRPITGPGVYTFGETCARLTFSPNQTGTLHAVTTTLAHAYPTPQTLDHPLPRTYTLTGDGEGYTATLTLCYDDLDLTAANITNTATLQLYRHLGNDEWQPYASVVNTATHEISTTINEFSVWATGMAAQPETCPHPLTGVAITGPLDITGSLYIGDLYTFRAVITPTAATLPITYTWIPAPYTTTGAMATYQWMTPGVHTITLRAENCGGAITTTRSFSIYQPAQHLIYLPLVLRTTATAFRQR